MKDVLRILVAPLVWLASFSAVYALHGFICGSGLSGAVFGLPLARVLLVLAYGVAIAVQGGLLWVAYSVQFASSSQFVRFVSRATSWAGVVATIWSLLPVVLTTYCLS